MLIVYLIKLKEKYVMSKSQLRGKLQTKTNKKAPENKDDIDSRSQEEFDFKGDDITHNKKEGRRDRAKVKNNMAK